MYKGGSKWSTCKKLAYEAGCVPLLIASKDQLQSPSNQRFLFELAVEGKLAMVLASTPSPLDVDESVMLGSLAGLSVAGSVESMTCVIEGKGSPLLDEALGGENVQNLWLQHVEWGESLDQVVLECLAQLTAKRDSLRRLDDINWPEHIRSGHWPPHRRCRTCIMASAQNRPRRSVCSSA